MSEMRTMCEFAALAPMSSSAKAGQSKRVVSVNELPTGFSGSRHVFRGSLHAGQDQDQLFIILYGQVEKLLGSVLRATQCQTPPE